MDSKVMGTGDALDALKQWQESQPKQTWVPYTPSSHPCPSCGHCPTCGRGGYYQPYWNTPIYPWGTTILCGTLT